MIRITHIDVQKHVDIVSCFVRVQIFGSTALDIAKEKGNLDIARLISVRIFAHLNAYERILGVFIFSKRSCQSKFCHAFLTCFCRLDRFSILDVLCGRAGSCLFCCSPCKAQARR